MKKLLFIVMGIFVASQVNAASRVQFDVKIDTYTCYYDSNGKLEMCNGNAKGDEVFQKRLTVNLKPVECTPKPECNSSKMENAFLNKKLTLNTSSGESVSLTYGLYFHKRGLSSDNNSKNERFVQLMLESPQAKELAERSTNYTYYEPTRFGRLSLIGEPKLGKSKKTGNKVAILPSLTVTNVKFLD